MRLALDTETSGLDLRHSARPFFITTCDEEGNQQYWEWDVNPITREVQIPKGDLDDIQDLINSATQLVLQNAKFDVTALASVRREIGDKWPWDKTVDTLVAGHLLASNQPHNLTAMAVHYLGINIEPYEKKLHDAVIKARRVARSRHKDWFIANAGEEGMPSVKGGSGKGDRGVETGAMWKADTWLPRAIAKAENYGPDKKEEYTWHTVLKDYANADSAVTVALWPMMYDEMRRRGLLKIFETRMKLLPITYRMESYGVTIHKTRLREMLNSYNSEVADMERRCKNIAATYIDTTGTPEENPNFGQPFKLTLPKSGVNDSLRRLCFDVMKLKPIRNPKAKTDAPTLDSKTAIPYYLSTLPENSKPLLFMKSLVVKRKRDTALSYMEGYEKFWLPIVDRTGRVVQDWYRMHPSLNMCGTDTLRWSCSNPNEQNISSQGMPCPICFGNGEDCEKCEGKGIDPRNIRYCFGPAPGREWWSLDAKNIEVRIPAYESGERDLIQLFENPDDPPYYGSGHFLNFHTVYPELWDAEVAKVGLEKVGPTIKKNYKSTWYTWCKNGSFGVQYGAVDKPGGGGTADIAFHKIGAHAMLKARFARLDAHNQWCIRFANKYGYIETIPDKTVDPERGYPLMCSRTEWGKILPTVPLNYRTQGSACWWMMKAMIRCQAQLDQWNSTLAYPDYHMVMQVHDELVFDLPKSNVHPKEDIDATRPDGCKLIRRSNLWRIRQIQKLMEQGGDDIGIPTPVSCELHETSWGEGMTF